MQRDDPLLGLGLMLGFCALAPLGDAMAKLIGDAIPLAQVLLVRFAVQALILWPLFRRSGAPLPTSPRLLAIMTLRTVLQITGFGTFIVALRFLPLADAIAIAYVMPFILLLLGGTFLGEHVGLRRLAACIVGFGGTLMVMQPSFVDVGWVAALPLLVAVIFALFMLVTRSISRETTPIALQAITGVIGTLLLFPVLLLGDGSGLAELDPVAPDRREIGLLLLLGLFASSAHLLMASALHRAPASTLAPVQYVEIPFAAAYGWLLFAEFPDGLALWGIAIVVVSGLYVIWRERNLARAKGLQSPPKGPSEAT